MRPTHSRYGQFALESPCTYAARPLARNIHHEGHADLLDAIMYQLRAKHFTSCAFTLDWLLVHLVYQGRDHGTKFLAWRMRLAEMDKVEQRLLAMEAGVRLHAKLGYCLMDTARLEGDSISPLGVTIHVMR